MTIKFDQEVIRLITAIENFTGASVKDCVVDEQTNTVYAIVDGMEEGFISGGEGRNLKYVERILGKSIKLVRYAPDVTVFAKNLVPQALKVNLTDDNVLEIWVSKIHKPMVIGREKRNLNLLKKIFQRNFNVKDVVIR